MPTAATGPLPSPPQPGRPLRRTAVGLAALTLLAVLALAGFSLAYREAAQVRPSAGARPADDGGELALPGPFAAGWRQVTVAPLSGGRFTALLTYPATRAGQETPLDLRGGPYPAVAFGHGFLQTPQRYQGTLEHLATWGYLIIAPESQSGLNPDHQGFAEDLGDGLAWLALETTRPESWLYGQVETTAFGLSGHSMGAGASLLAAAADRSIAAVANLAAAETRPSAVAAMPRILAPLALIVGSEDSIVPPEATGRMYTAARAPKQFVTLEGGWHCGFQDEPFPIGCDSGSLPREEQLALTRQRLTAFFELYLRQDGTRYDDVWGVPEDPRLSLIADPGRAGPPPKLALPWVGDEP